jgi:two-component system sensor histidine kinase BaeS
MSTVRTPIPPHGTMRLGLLWTFGALAGALGALLVFDAQPGINWAIWTGFTVAGLLVYLRPDRPALRTLALPLGFAVALAAGSAVTTTPVLLIAVLAIVASLMALALTTSRRESADGEYGATEIVSAPVLGLAMTLRGGTSALAATIQSIDRERDHPVLRGSLMAAPIVVVLALLFASADPVLARWRDTIYGALSAWSGVPRIVFGILVALFVTGAYFAAWRARSQAAPPLPASPPLAPARSTEWRIVIGAAAVVSWFFVLLQITYLFGTVPSMVGSGVSFAEYARRGFAELAIAATGSALLIVAAHQRVSPTSEPQQASSRLRLPSLALLAAVSLVLVSAFHRVNLYEDAYGYTTMRVYAQAYMMLTLGVLVVLAWHLSRSFDTRAVAREVMTVALTTLTVLVFWNGDAWVARANVGRYASTGKIDLAYLTRGLSPDAYPALVGSLPGLAAPERAQLTSALQQQYARRPYMRAGNRWYEWNVRRRRARAALASLAITAGVGQP